MDERSQALITALEKFDQIKKKVRTWGRSGERKVVSYMGGDTMLSLRSSSNLFAPSLSFLSQNPQPHDKRIYKVLNALQKHKKPPYEVGVVSMVVDCAALVPLPLMNMGFQRETIKGGGKKTMEANKTYALEDIDEEFPFLFPFLQNLLTCSDSQTQGTSSPSVAAEGIFKEILKILSTLHHQLRMAPESIER